MQFFADSHLDVKNGIQQTPLGLTIVNEYGTLRHASGAAGILAIYARGLEAKGQTAVADEIMKFAEQQVFPSSRKRHRCRLFAGHSSIHQTKHLHPSEYILSRIRTAVHCRMFTSSTMLVCNLSMHWHGPADFEKSALSLNFILTHLHCAKRLLLTTA